MTKKIIMKKRLVKKRLYFDDKLKQYYILDGGKRIIIENPDSINKIMKEKVIKGSSK